MGLFKKAFKAPLSLQQQQQLQRDLEGDPKLVENSRMTPDKLPSLVENNPIIAIDALFQLLVAKKADPYAIVIY